MDLKTRIGILTIFILINCKCAYTLDIQIKRVLNVTSKVGTSITLKCQLDPLVYGNSPGIIWIQGRLGNVLTLNTNRITADTRFSVQNTQTRLLHRNNHVNEASKSFDLTIDNLRISDENEYVCESSGADETPIIHSLIYLRVTESPSFLEERTSPSNIISNENDNTTLLCYANGRPEPKIKWYRIDQITNAIKDLNYESNGLIITNKYHKNHYMYECIATNGIEPSVSKRFTLTVLFSPIVYSLQFQVFHSIGQSATLGCNIISHPESYVIWFKNDQLIERNLSSQKYEFKETSHTNQTMSYLKINNLESNDFGRYKCEARNQIGSKWQNIQLVEMRNLHTTKSSHNHHKHRPSSVTTTLLKATTSISNIIENTDNHDEDYEIDLLKNAHENKQNESINMFIIRKKNHKRRKHNKTLEYHMKNNQLVDDDHDDLSIHLSGLTGSTIRHQVSQSHFIFMFLCFNYLL